MKQVIPFICRTFNGNLFFRDEPLGVGEPPLMSFLGTVCIILPLSEIHFTFGECFGFCSVSLHRLSRTGWIDENGLVSLSAKLRLFPGTHVTETSSGRKVRKFPQPCSEVPTPLANPSDCFKDVFLGSSLAA